MAFHATSDRLGRIAVALFVSAILGVVSSCAGTGPRFEPVDIANPNTVPQRFEVDASGRPIVNRFKLPPSQPFGFPELFGVQIDEAEEWARRTGWTEVGVFAQGDREYVHPLNLEEVTPDRRITLVHLGGTVVEAWAG